MKGCFPQHQDEVAAFLEAAVGGSDDEVFVVAVRDSDQTLDRTANHDHALRPKGATGNGLADVLMVVYYIAELSQVLDGEVGFSQQRARQRGGDDELHLDAPGCALHLERLDAVNGAGCACNCNYESLQFQFSSHLGKRGA
jgi:hypothetical protein